MVELYKQLDEKDEVILALKISNHERQVIIDDLIAGEVEKDKKIADLMLQNRILVDTVKALKRK